MPAFNDILREINAQGNSLDFVRRKYLLSLSKKTGRNIIIYYSGWLQKRQFSQLGIDFGINDSDKIGLMTTIKDLDCSLGLDLFLHTPGGEIAATESIVHYLKSKFGNNIRAIVPQIAMSAGTMIACSTKEILMGRQSNLGPIDPQIGGLPTHGIIDEFENAKEDIAANPLMIPIWQTILSKYHPTLIGECMKAIKWSEEIVSSWLKQNMFEKDPDKSAKVSNIMQEMASHEATLSHSRHLHIDLLRDKLGLNIIEMENDQELQDLILSIHHASIITLSSTPAYKIIENHQGNAFIQNIPQINP